MTVTAGPATTRSPTGQHYWPAVLALTMGGFAIGTTEFVTMGLIEQISDGVHVSIPTGGHVISAYALGVVVGAPVLAFFGLLSVALAVGSFLSIHRPVLPWLLLMAATGPLAMDVMIAVRS